MSEYIEFKISDDILRALRLRGAPSSEGERLCFEAADEYEKGNYETAVKLWRTSAELNDGYAQLCLRRAFARDAELSATSARRSGC